MAEVEVDEVFGLVRDEAAKVATNDAVPGRAFSLIKRALDVLCNVLFNSKFGHGFLSNFNGLLLHIVGHISRLDLSIKLVPGQGGLGG